MMYAVASHSGTDFHSSSDTEGLLIQWMFKNNSLESVEEKG